MSNEETINRALDEEKAEALREEEQTALFARLRESNSEETRNALIEDNLQMVFPIARKFRSTGENLEDLLQVGYIGLIKAVDNFDTERGVKFITYASHCITGEIRHYLRDKSCQIKQPRWLRRLNLQVSEFVERHLQKRQKLPTIREIAGNFNISEEGIIEILKSKKPVSFTNISGNEGAEIAYDRIKAIRYETFRLPIEDRIALEEAIEDLKTMEKKIIFLFFYQDLTQTQIAKNMGLSQKKVSRMLQKSIEKLRGILFPTQ